MRTDGPVVIALDGSAHSADTLVWGVAEAVLRGADVLLVRVYREQRELTEWSWYPLPTEDLGFDVDAKQYLAEQLAQQSALHPALAIETRVVHGVEAPELRKLSEDAQLLVVGASDHSGPVRLGSVSGHLAAHARCPVAVVRSDVAETTGAPVAVGVDGSSASLAAAEVAAREAGLRRVPLVVVQARPTIADLFGRGMAPMSGPVVVRADEDDPARRAANGIFTTLRAEHPDLEVRVELVDDEAVHALITAGRTAQLLVVGSRGHGAFVGMLIGAVSRAVVQGAPCTVLVMHDGEKG